MREENIYGKIVSGDFTNGIGLDASVDDGMEEVNKRHWVVDKRSFTVEAGQERSESGM